MNKVPQKIFSCILALCLILSIAVPVFAEESRPAASDWMSMIDGSLTLAQFTIPGTHNSAAQNCVFGKCQSVGIEKQLEMGVRFLDIRLKTKGGKLSCYHSIVNCFVSFDDVMSSVASFLKAHPEECVIMSIKNEAKNSAAFESDLVRNWIDSDAYSDLWYVENRIPTLDEVRGRIVLLRRYANYDDSLARGINAGRNWDDDATFIMERASFTLAIQDDYQYNTLLLKLGKRKWQAFSALDEAISINDPDNRADLLWLNFANGSNMLGYGQFSCAVTVNKHICSEFAGAAGNHGIVIMDYVNSDLVNTVMMTNFNS